MKARTFLFKLSTAIAPLVAALAMGSAPVAQAAAPPILVDDAASATDCGKYSGKTADTDPVHAINTAASGRTVLICPGTYNLTGLGDIIISNKKLTVRRALTGAGSRPILTIDSADDTGIDIGLSTVTIDGLILDASLDAQSNYYGLYVYRSPVTVKNSGFIGPDQPGSLGIFADASGQTQVKNLSVTNSYFAGYNDVGIVVKGPIKLSLKSSLLDGTDGDRLTLGSQTGVIFNGQVPGAGPTGLIIKNRVLNNLYGIWVSEASKVSVANNTLVNNRTGVLVTTSGIAHSADNNKVTGNTILGVPVNGFGVYITDTSPLTSSVKKTMVSKNTIVAAPYSPTGIVLAAVYVWANAPASTMLTVTVSGNTFVGFPPARRVFNEGGNAGLKIKNNDAIP